MVQRDSDERIDSEFDFDIKPADTFDEPPPDRPSPRKSQPPRLWGAALVILVILGLTWYAFRSEPVVEMPPPSQPAPTSQATAIVEPVDAEEEKEPEVAAFVPVQPQPQPTVREKVPASSAPKPAQPKPVPAAETKPAEAKPAEVKPAEPPAPAPEAETAPAAPAAAPPATPEPPAEAIAPEPPNEPGTAASAASGTGTAAESAPGDRPAQAGETAAAPAGTEPVASGASSASAGRAAKPEISDQWVVNISSTPNAEDSLKLLSRVMSQDVGGQVYTYQATVGGRPHHRIRVGFFATRAEAEEVGRKIKETFSLAATPWAVQPTVDEVKRFKSE